MRPIITASQPVSRTMRTASSGVTMSPLPITGDVPHRGLHFSDAGPIRLAAIALLARARMQRDGLQSAIFGELSHFHGHQLLIVPAGAELHGERNRDGRPHLAQDLFHQRQIAQQSRTAVALHHFVDRAAEVDVDDIESKILASLGRVGHHLGIGAKQLRRDGMLLRLEVQIAKRPRRLLCLRANATTPCELVNSVMMRPQPP